ncbi:MAG: spore germination protein [Bacillota bacterium]
MLRTKARYDKIIEALDAKNLAMSVRTIPFDGGELSILYIKQLTDRAGLADNVVKPLIQHCSIEKKPLKAAEVMDTAVYADDCRLESDEEKIAEFILAGTVVIIFSTDKQYLVINLKQIEHRQIPTPETTYALRAPKDCFTENLDVNIALIRYRVKDENLRIKTFEVGRRTKTSVAVVYIEDIANDTAVTEIQKRIEAIDIDGIGESGELQAFLLNKKSNLFPQMGLLERSDMAYNTLVEGKVLTLVEGSPVCLVAPKVFAEYFHSCDDRYDNKYFGAFMRLIRYAALYIALASSSLYVAIIAFNTSVLPGEYAIAVAEMRSKVPLSAFVGALVLEFLIELVREALLRVPKQIGPAVGIVGTIIIGQAAIASGVFSPLLLIIVSISLLASFAIGDYSMANPFRILKFALLIFTGAFGFYGFVLCISLILISLVSVNSFGVPFLAPFAPFKWYDFIRSIFFNVSISPLRPKYLRNKDKKRAKTSSPD